MLKRESAIHKFCSYKIWQMWPPSDPVQLGPTAKKSTCQIYVTPVTCVNQDATNLPTWLLEASLLHQYFFRLTQLFWSPLKMWRFLRHRFWLPRRVIPTRRRRFPHFASSFFRVRVTGIWKLATKNPCRFSLTHGSHIYAAFKWFANSAHFPTRLPLAWTSALLLTVTPTPSVLFWTLTSSTAAWTSCMPVIATCLIYKAKWRLWRPFVKSVGWPTDWTTYSAG